MKIQIKHRHTCDVIFESEAASVKLAVVDAVGKKVSLAGADLSNQNLTAIEIFGGNFVRSRFDGSRFDGSRFDGSRFVRSSFDGSRFVRSSFVRSSFDGSSFDDSRFDGSSFIGSSFVRSSFIGSRFDDSTAESLKAAWPQAKTDLWSILDVASREAPGLLDALKNGKVDGSVYEGECACLVGTIANIKQCRYTDIADLSPDSSRPAESWFIGISKGDTPQTSPIVRITCDWIEEWQAAQPAVRPVAVPQRVLDSVYADKEKLN